ncbi:MAG: acyl-CoA dehydrogenase family protein [Deltaproteobacteria bacterium]|nr:acyl-CoA dehydrogenase family protein [Deltaproteobacteria bacterium]MBW2122179.1 acyl-CoA dehydrogenase family protein [Deltaproteobacteria bacterium]
MDFELDEGHAFLRQTVRDFAEKEISPIADAIDREERFPFELFERLAQLGYAGVGIPREYQGSFSDYLSVVIMGEELSRVSASVPVALFPHSILCAHNIYRYGTEGQKEKYLPDLAAGKKWGAMALTEVSAGSDALSLRTRAERSGSEYILNGSKTFVTNVPFADLYLIYAKTAPEKGPDGISAFIVEKGFAGFATGRNFEKLGLRGSPTGEVFLDACRVPSENLLGGQEGRGFRHLTEGLDVERVSWSSIALGLAQASFESALAYSQERVQFGRPIIEFQMIQRMISEMAVSVEAARLLVYKAADLLDKGKRARFEASSAKLFSTETAVKVSGDALQVYGGAGYIKDYPVERYFRDAKILTVAAGSSEVQRMIIVHELKRK